MGLNSCQASSPLPLSAFFSLLFSFLNLLKVEIRPTLLGFFILYEQQEVLIILYEFHYINAEQQVPMDNVYIIVMDFVRKVNIHYFVWTEIWYDL